MFAWRQTSKILIVSLSKLDMILPSRSRYSGTGRRCFFNIFPCRAQSTNTLVDDPLNLIVIKTNLLLDLYGRLVTEWLSSEKSALDEGNPESGDSYEELPGTKKLEARTEWEKVVFESPDVDRQALLDYLNLLFGSHQEDKEADTDSEVAMAINELRREVASFESDLNNAQHFSVQNLHWVIRGLEASDLLSNEKREVLKDFLGNRIILGEIADVLNMRMATLNRWSWGDHVPLEERRNVNGGYTIQMHEDLLQAIFLHYIGVKWSVFFKTSFISFRRRAWKKNEVNIPKIDRLRREYYTQESLYKEANSSLQKKRRRIHKKAYFFNQLIDYEGQVVDTLQGEEEAEFRSYAKSAQVPRQSGGRTHQTAAKKFSGGKAKRTVRPAAKMAASYDYSTYQPESSKRGWCPPCIELNTY